MRVVSCLDCAHFGAHKGQNNNVFLEVRSSAALWSWNVRMAGIWRKKKSTMQRVISVHCQVISLHHHSGRHFITSASIRVWLMLKQKTSSSASPNCFEVHFALGFISTGGVKLVMSVCFSTICNKRSRSWTVEDKSVSRYMGEPCLTSRHLGVHGSSPYHILHHDSHIFIIEVVKTLSNTAACALENCECSWLLCNMAQFPCHTCDMQNSCLCVN